jgi:hypothetical protein
MRHGPRGPEKAGKFAAYLTDDRVSNEERGWVMLALIGHAFFFLLLTATEAVWVAVVSARVWRQRDAGLARAVRANVHRPSLIALLAAQVLHAVLRKAVVTKLDQRSDSYAGPGESTRL